MEALQDLVREGEMRQAGSDARLTRLAGALERLTDELGDANPTLAALGRVAEGQEALIHELRARGGSSTEAGIDAESRMRLRSIDVQMLRVLEEISAGRQEMMAELRVDIADLGRVLGGQPAGRVRKLHVTDGRPDSAENEG